MRSPQPTAGAPDDPGVVRDILFFVRFSAIGFSMAVVLLGAATAMVSVTPTRVIALCLIGAAYHAFAFVLNDVVDLPIDRTEPRRWGSPLVRGRVRPAHALVFALAQIPLTFALAFGLGVGPGGMGALAAAFALMAIYNLWGKRSPLPMLTDLVQALAWACLAWLGALAAPGPPDLHSLLVAAFVVVYVLMTNGVHGSVRDLRNDLTHAVRSTAIQLGATVEADGRPRFSTPLRAYAVGLQLLLVVLVVLPFVHGEGPDPSALGHLPAAVALSAGGLSFLLLRRAWNPEPGGFDLEVAGMLHLVAVMVAFLAALAPHLHPGLLVLAGGVFTAPLLTHDATYRWARWGWNAVRRGWST